MVLKWINKLGVESSEGYVVQFTGLYSCEYIEKSKKITVYIEIGSLEGKDCCYFSTKSFLKWDDGEKISENNQKRIITNFVSGVEFQNLKTSIHDDELIDYMALMKQYLGNKE